MPEFDIALLEHNPAEAVGVLRAALAWWFCRNGHGDKPIEEYAEDLEAAVSALLGAGHAC